jgi:hypothetical protein
LSILNIHKALSLSISTLSGNYDNAKCVNFLINSIFLRRLNVVKHFFRFLFKLLYFLEEEEDVYGVRNYVGDEEDDPPELADHYGQERTKRAKVHPSSLTSASRRLERVLEATVAAIRVHCPPAGPPLFVDSMKNLKHDKLYNTSKRSLKGIQKQFIISKN